MTDVLVREVAADLRVRDDGDGRTLVGPLLPWGITARVLDRGRLVDETFQRGALAGTDPTRVPLTALHPKDNQQLPIGVTVELEERDDAAWGAWRVSKTALGDEVLALARDGVPLGLSVGFMELPGGSSWSPDRSRVTRTRAALDHVAIVRKGAYVGAAVVGFGRRAHGHPRRTRCCPWPGCAMGKGGWLHLGHGQGRCWKCGVRFAGPGDRCHRCRDELRQRRKRKRR